ncbi:MAG: hypothetical protein RR140_03095 [Clostridia bacterium]
MKKNEQKDKNFNITNQKTKKTSKKLKLIYPIEIIEVKKQNDKKRFVDFPIKLYKKCPFFVPPLRGDELNLFNDEKNVSYEDCDVICYLALQNKRVVGRICGIIQKLYNLKVSEKRVRFTRFDCVNNVEVAKKLFNAVEAWAKNMGMEIVHGPLGFNDLDREGMLIDGFDYIATFEEQYNYAYYPKLVEACGYEKEIDWLEYKIFPPKEVNERVDRLAEIVLKRFNLKIAHENSKKKFLERYKQGVFDVIDDAYGDLHGVVPYTDKVRKQLIDQFKLFIELKYIIVLVDQTDKVVAFGFALPSLSKALSNTNGKILPNALKIFKALKRPKVLDFALIGIRKEYLGKGLPAVILRYIMEQGKALGIEYFETNLNLEDNVNIHHQWKNFEHEQHKRRRCYVKKLI